LSRLSKIHLPNWYKRVLLKVVYSVALFFVFSGTGFVLRAFCFAQASVLPLEPYPQALLFVTFSDRLFCFLPGQDLVYDSPTSAYCITGLTGLYHHVHFVCWECGLSNFLYWADLKTVLPVSASQVARIVGMYQHASLSLILNKQKHAFLWKKAFIFNLNHRYFFMIGCLGKLSI
jgi:hypothetical protein